MRIVRSVGAGGVIFGVEKSRIVAEVWVFHEPLQVHIGRSHRRRHRLFVRRQGLRRQLRGRRHVAGDRQRSPENREFGRLRPDGEEPLDAFFLRQFFPRLIVEAPLHPFDDRIHHPTRLHRRSAVRRRPRRRAAGTRGRGGTGAAAGRRGRRGRRVVVPLQSAGEDEGGKRVKVREERQRVNQFRRAPLFLLEIFRQLSDVTLSHEPGTVGENLVDDGQFAEFIRRPMEALQPGRVAAEVQKVPGERLRQRRTADARHRHDADVGAVGERQGTVAGQQMQVAFDENLQVFRMKVQDADQVVIAHPGRVVVEGGGGGGGGKVLRRETGLVVVVVGSLWEIVIVVTVVPVFFYFSRRGGGQEERDGVVWDEGTDCVLHRVDMKRRRRRGRRGRLRNTD